MTTICINSTTVGKTLKFSVDINTGTPAFNVTLTKDGVLPAIGSWTTQNLTHYEITYVVQSGDVGTHLFQCNVSDINGKTASESCATTINPVSNTGNVQFNSTPTQAEIWIDGINTGYRTNYLIQNLVPGNHSYTLKSSGYQDAIGNVTVTTGQTTTVNITLIPVAQVGSITFSTSPSGARVSLNSVDQGVNTPITLTNLTPATYGYTLKLAGYQDANGNVSVTANQTSTVNVTLTPITSTGNVQFVTTPVGADIYIDGSVQSVKTNATIPNLPAGSHSYMLMLTGYQAASGTFTISANQLTVVNVTLTQTGGDTGSILFVSSPSGAEVFLDGLDKNAITPYTATNVPVGAHNYMLRLANYNDSSGMIVVNANQISMVTVVLQPGGGGQQQLSMEMLALAAGAVLLGIMMSGKK